MRERTLTFCVSVNMLVRVFFLAICTWTANAASIDYFRRDYTFDPVAGVWLKFHPIPLKWYQAVLRCHHEGAILASPLNEELTKALTTIMMEHGVTTAPIFAGTAGIYTGKEFQSMEGVPISNMCLRWSAEPDVKDTKIAHCIAMNANGTVTAVPCSDHHSFVCYRQKGVKKLNKCGTVDPEYVFSPQVGSCYKTSKKELTWNDAYISCATDGAHLAIINSHEEVEVLKELRRKYLPNTAVFLGMQSWAGEWITVQGQSLEEAGYSKWYTDEPNNAGGVEICGSMYEDIRKIVLLGMFEKELELKPFEKELKLKPGVLNDVPCDQPKHFICEIESPVEAN